jgi:hypothetical protein
MKTILTGALLLAGLALAAPVAAAPGQCSMTGFDSFDCDVTADGGSVTFALPDGQVFAFAQEANGEGQGYLIAADAAPGQRPQELGRFAPVEGEAGCWLGARDGIKFCAALVQ